MKTKRTAALIATTVLVTACNFDKPREAKPSDSLTGLWKISSAYGAGDNTTWNEPYLLVDNANNISGIVKVTTCLDRSEKEGVLLERSQTNGLLVLAQTFSNFPGMPSEKFFKVTNPFKNNYMWTEADPITKLSRIGRKMSLTPEFDMGSYTIKSSILPSATITKNNCTITKTVNNLTKYSESIDIVVGYKGDLLRTSIRFVEKFGIGKYDIETTAEKGKVEVTLSSDGFAKLLGKGKVPLTSGTLTVVKRNDVWFNGKITSTLPGGDALEIDFEAELPLR